MKKIQAGILITILIMANIASIQALEITPSDEGAPKQEVSIHMNPLQHLYQILKNLFSTILENLFSTVGLLFQPAPKHSTPLPTSPIIHSAADSNFDYVASSPYYKASFKGVKTRINVPEGWIEFNLKENRVKAGEMAELESNKERVSLTNSSTVSENKLFVSDVFEATDLDYVAETSVLHEILVLKQYKSFDRIISEISWDGLTPEFQEDGSILFSGGKPVLRIFPPTMTDALGNICNSLHYAR
ncbi:MAG: hypothetical protein HXS52_12735 [Theionarchaea archaeon]|nr:hypothetical protein [Theionarchaea archaeon]